MTFDPVAMEDEGSLLCKVVCGEEKKQIRTLVRVYCEFIRTFTQVLYRFEVLVLYLCFYRHHVLN